MKKSPNKVTSLKDAVAEYVHDGDSVAFSGMAGEQCVASAFEIVRQGKKNLTIIGDSPCDVGDILIGAGLVRKIEVAWLGYAVAGLAMNYRRAVEEGVPNSLEIEEYSNFTAGLRFLAGAMNVSFLPTRSLLGSDIPKYNPRIKVINDPYSGGPIALVPAANPDTGLVHVHKSDILGNAQIFGWSANAENIARAARHTILTCEEIVSTEEISLHPNCTLVPQFCVDAVVHVPFGSHPWNMPYYYAYDIPRHMEQMVDFRTREGFLRWLDKWVFGCQDHTDYCRQVGWDRLLELQRVERKFTKMA
jgi:glutaconate CoA-transferase subunit A